MLSKIIQESVKKIKLMGSVSFNGSQQMIPEENIERLLISSQISLLEAELERKKGMMRQVDNEEPFVPFYKPYGMSEEEYTSEVQRHEQDRGEWQSNCEYNQAIQEDITYLTAQIEEIKKLI